MSMFVESSIASRVTLERLRVRSEFTQLISTGYIYLLLHYYTYWFGIIHKYAQTDS